MSDVLLQEIRERRIYASTEWDEIQSEAKKDRLCVAGKPWQALDPDAVKERNDTKRPMLALDELGQYINQTVNDVRANPRGIRFAPTGNGANDKGAEFYQNHTREIEYRSHAKVGYSTAFDNCVTSSYGWLRVRTQREHVRTFNQDIWIDPIVNPDQVLPDPNSVWPDSRDMKFLYYIEPWPTSEFTRTFPKAKIRSFSPELRGIAGQWFQKDTVQVAEYWKIETFKRRLVAFRRKGKRPGEEEFALVDELPGGRLPSGAENLREEEVEDTRVKSYLTNGLEILKENPWKGKHIPFVSCFGKILYVDEGSGSKRKIMSMTRLARDPYMLYCYIRTCEAEAIGGVPRATWVGYEGQFAKPNNWVRANREPVAFLEAKVNVEGTTFTSPLPLPHREPWDPPLQNLDLAAEAARRAIQAAMGISPLPTAMQRQNQKSGRAMDKMEASQQKGSFHFVDHYELMVERTGVLIEDLIDKTIDTARDVPVRKPDETGITVRTNDPNDPESISTNGDYRVTISTGPASDSQRQDGSDFVDSMVTNIATIAQLAGPQKAAALLAKSVKLKQLGPIGDEIEQLLSPPQQAGPDGKPISPEVQALKGQVQQLQQQVLQATQIIQTEQVKQQALAKIQLSKEKIADIESRRRAATAIAVAKIQASAKGGITEREAQNEALALAAEQEFDAEQARLDREHELALAAADAQHEGRMADVGHQQALEQGQAGVAGQLAMQAAAPQPDAGVGA